MQQAVILAGGKGTRLGPLGHGRPKALLEIAGKPLVEHQLEVARRYGIIRILMLTGYLGDVLADYLGDGSRFGLDITYHRETEPLGTAGSLKSAESLLDETFFVFYGDIIFDMDLDRVAAFHAARHALATLVVHPNDHPHDSDVVEVDAGDNVLALHRKTRSPNLLVPNLVNAGVYLLDRRCCDFIAADTFADFGLDTFPAMLEAGQSLAAYNTPEFAKDVGTPQRRQAVETDILSGKVARRNIANLQGAVFLDRDGVIIAERGDAIRAGDVALLPGVAEALGRLNRTDFLSLVVTNQPGIAKGFVTESEVADAHKQIDTLLGAAHAYVHAYYFCPHHPTRGFAGERPELKIDCDCRKPRPGMLLRGAERFHVDLGRSFMVGDRSVDTAAGLAAGTCTIGLRTGYGHADTLVDVSPDFICDDLPAAIDLIIDCQPLIEPACRIAELVTGSEIQVAGDVSPQVSLFAHLLRWQLRRRRITARLLSVSDDPSASPTDEPARDDVTILFGPASLFATAPNHPASIRVVLTAQGEPGDGEAGQADNLHRSDDRQPPLMPGRADYVIAVGARSTLTAPQPAGSD